MLYDNFRYPLVFNLVFPLEYQLLYTFRRSWRVQLAKQKTLIPHLFIVSKRFTGNLLYRIDTILYNLL